MNQCNLNILVWNVRGLGMRSRRDHLRSVVADANASIVCIQETKLAAISSFLVSETLGTRFASFAYLPSVGASGGILVACKGPEVCCTVMNSGRFSVTVNIAVEATNEQWVLTTVYGPQPDTDKIKFLAELRSIHALLTGPWIIVGDFNLLLHASDKNNVNINQRNLGRFRRFVVDLQLKDIFLHGRRYTWSNERSTPTTERLDRVLVAVDWELNYPFCYLQALSSDISDHCPLLISTNASFHAKRRFHFENWWLKIPGYLDAVQAGWVCNDAITDPLYRIDAKLKNTARHLQSWSQRTVGQIKSQLLIARTIVLWLDKAQEARFSCGKNSN